MSDINTIAANFDEARQSQLPFVEMLINMGYTYLSTEEALIQRRGDISKFLLKDIAFAKLKEINSYDYNGEQYPFADKDVWEAVDELENLPLEGLLDTSAKVFNMIMPTSGGKTIRVSHGGKNESKNFRFIDFANPENNTFHVTVEFEARGRGTIRPDIVCFVNGIPFVIVENKKGSVDLEEALSQQNRNQRAEYCPKLFVYPQLLVAANGSELRYGTAGTPNKFYAAWREKGVSDEEMDRRVRELIIKPIDRDVYSQLCADLHGTTFGHRQIIDRIPTEQDRSVISLFAPERLLDLSKNHVLYDAGIKKVSRYQQYFAIQKMLKRIEENDPDVGERRRHGGLVWHTQGSGKSLTMVMFVRALIEHSRISNPRVIVVTDRKDLDKQIGDTFRNCNLKKKVTRAKSGQHLLDLIREKNLTVIATLVHKFESATRKKAGFVDDSRDIFVLVDEAHRNQSGIAHAEMRKVMPNACYIGFTGTPLMKKDRASYLTFGTYIDKYTIDDALRDKVVLPLIYEGRYVDLVQNKEQIDRRVERLIEDLDDKEKKELQRFVGKSVIKDNPQRIAEIAYDIEKHYIAQFQGSGLKAQIVAPSKFSAVLFQRYFEMNGLVQTALVISDDDGKISEENTHRKEVVSYLDTISARYKSLASYETAVVDDFKHNEDGVEILIVVDKLLTGFDAPCNTVLYLAKDLRDHNLLQAIARVNRLFENERLPKSSGFIIDYSENAKNLDVAMRLFGNFDEEDVKGALFNVKDKIAELEKSYADVHDLFKAVNGSRDSEAYVRTLDDEADRRSFYEALNGFIKNFKECLVLRDFTHEFKHLDVYQRELKKLLEIRKAAELRYADKIDLSKYKLALIDILDQYVDASGVELLTKPVNITDAEQFKKAVDELGSDRSKAEAIAAQTERVIIESMEKDPEYYQRFSDRIHDLLEQMRTGKIADVEALGQMKLLREDVLAKQDSGLPPAIAEKTGADIFYRNLKPILLDLNLGEDKIIEVIFGLMDALYSGVIVDWHKNPEVKRQIADMLDDYLYDILKQKYGMSISGEQLRAVVASSMQLAENNHQIFDV